MLEKTMIKTLAKHYKGGDFCIEFWDKERVCFGEGEPKFCIKIHKKLPLNFINPRIKITLIVLFYLFWEQFL